MTGPWINFLAILSGTLFAVLFKKRINGELIKKIPDIFALITFGIGVYLIVKIDNFVIVTLSIIIGFIIGELSRLEKGVVALSGVFQRKLSNIDIFKVPPAISREKYSETYTTLVVLFCTGATGIIGSLTEGMTGNYDLLLVKSVIDFFTVIAFCLILGASVFFIAIPLFIIETTLYCTASALMTEGVPLQVIHNFSGCGGIILIGAAMNISGIKRYPVLSITPALVIAFVATWYFT
ncbi:DUF554 domain-containing protein [Entomohabitans teleogrylli]|uniref:DUF554 domain-containing protein n=1 Tax=Entomohabitans teleogrylli TaxID=1384589 RepID=UPI00073D4505|nr:DUF554 domain-containing protein [Entomohabitans teleogrylli]